MDGIIRFISAVSDLKSCIENKNGNIKTGDVFLTLGYNQINDGQGGLYLVSTVDYLFEHKIPDKNLIRVKGEQKLVLLPIKMQDITLLTNEVAGIKKVIDLSLR